jgi:hypothetical protein
MNIKISPFFCPGGGVAGDIKTLAGQELNIPKQTSSYLISKGRNLPRNGGIADKSSLLPYKNPMPVGPHI